MASKNTPANVPPMTPGDMCTPTTNSLAAPTLDASRIFLEEPDLLLDVVAWSSCDSILSERMSATLSLVGIADEVIATTSGRTFSMEITRSRRSSAAREKRQKREVINQKRKRGKRGKR